MIRSPGTRQNPATVVFDRELLLQERLTRLRGSSIPEDKFTRDKNVLVENHGDATLATHSLDSRI